MPTYEYICNGCGHEFELFQSMRDPVKRKCPKCAKPKLERLIGTGAAVIFKGSGFYETDYRSDSYKKSAEAETKSTSGDGEKKDPKKDSAKSEPATATPDDTSKAKASSDSPASPKRPSSKSAKPKSADRG